MKFTKLILVLLSVFCAASVMAQEKIETATFAGGCFWCMEQPFDELPGVTKTTAGYTGGHRANPTYEEVSSGATGHAEAIQVEYDPSIVSYEKLLDTFWRNIDPTTKNKQFADSGTQYRTAIFYHNDEQKKLAEASKAAQEATGRYKKHPIVTEITAASSFYPAEDYHQDYYQKSADHYKWYKKLSGREGYLKKMWGDDKKSAKKLQACPDEWIEDRMPSPTPQKEKPQYFIIDGQRRETSEFDLDWIKKNCAIKPQIVM